MKNKLIVVLGMHRSGTSAIARGIHALGCELGEILLENGIIKDEGQPYGVLRKYNDSKSSN